MTDCSKHRKAPEDLIKTDMMLKDFGESHSQAKGVLNVELTIGKVVSADTSIRIVTADAPAWEIEGTECLSGKT